MVATWSLRSIPAILLSRISPSSRNSAAPQFCQKSSFSNSFPRREQRRTSPGGERGTLTPLPWHMEQCSDKRGRLQFLHQNSSLVPGENDLLRSSMDSFRIPGCRYLTCGMDEAYLKMNIGQRSGIFYKSYARPVSAAQDPLPSGAP